MLVSVSHWGLFEANNDISLKRIEEALAIFEKHKILPDKDGYYTRYIPARSVK